MPFIVNWPGMVKPGVSDALVSQVDLLASMSSFLHQPTPASVSDSADVMPALLGQSKTGRTWLVEESDGIAIRKGNWKLIPPHRGLDIVMKDEEGQLRTKTGMKVPQLFDLATDPGEKTNIAKDHAHVVKELTDLLNTVGDQKDSTTRPPQ